MNRFLIIFINFLLLTFVHSQSIDSYVLGNSGNYFVNDKSLSFTIGEPVVFTNVQTNHSVFQGFQNVVIALNEDLFIHNIDLPQGWSYWSTYLSPKHSAISDMFNDISDNLVILKDQHGNVYWPYFGIDGIQNHAYGYGYQVKMQQSENLEVRGYKIENPSIQLFENWNIMGYLYDTPLALEEVMSPIAGEVIIIKDELANVYWPFLGINTIGNMAPGEAYAVKLYSDIDFLFSGIDNFSRLSEEHTIFTKHYNNIMSTGDNMIIGISEFCLEDLVSYGDEIGVFDTNNMLVGSAVFKDSNIAIAVWGDDFSTDFKDGMYEGENMIFKIWNQQCKQEKIIMVSHWEEGSAHYNSNGISIIGGFDEINNREINLRVYNNPVVNNLALNLDLKDDSFVSLVLTNSIGKSETLFNTYLFSGSHDFNFSIQKNPGLYYITIYTHYGIKTVPISIISN